MGVKEGGNHKGLMTGRGKEGGINLAEVGKGRFQIVKSNPVNRPPQGCLFSEYHESYLDIHFLKKIF